ncbi:MAG: DUF3467 domain-containing protein [Flavobacteriales bacterium]
MANEETKEQEQEQEEEQSQELNIEIPEDVAEGIYSNLAVITHSNSEFVLDFVRVMPSTPKSKVKSRVILTPHHAKRLMRALQDNMQKFESLHGEVSEPDQGGEDGEGGGIPMNFGGPTAKA